MCILSSLSLKFEGSAIVENEGWMWPDDQYHSDEVTTALLSVLRLVSCNRLVKAARFRWQIAEIGLQVLCIFFNLWDLFSWRLKRFLWDRWSQMAYALHSAESTCVAAFSHTVNRSTEDAFESVAYYTSMGSLIPWYILNLSHFTHRCNDFWRFLD